jgi:tRNA threonylcarbamoyladenosine dehydratase
MSEIMEDKYTRSRILFGDENLQTLQKSKILLLGVGGVGSYALDCLYRNGVEDITIVDFDEYDVTNQNRQMWSELHLGESKVASLQIHYPNVTIIEKRIDKTWVDEYDFEPYDLVLDAIDDVGAKVALAKKTYKKLISSMGSAKQMDPTKIAVTSIWKTTEDPFARKIRYQLKKERFNKNYQVIYSLEQNKCTEKGSFCGVTGAFGLTMCSLAMRKILGMK